MKAILVIDIDNSFMVLDEDSITLEYGTIKYRDINRKPFKITLEGLRLKPMPKEQHAKWSWGDDDFQKGWNACIDEILGVDDD